MIQQIMYQVRGGDQLEYGPIPAERVMEWIGQRRLDRRSLARRMGETEWRPLGEFPEFAAALAATEAPPQLPQSPATIPALEGFQARHEAEDAVRLPGTLLAIYGGLTVLQYIVGLFMRSTDSWADRTLNLSGDIPPAVANAIRTLFAMPAPLLVAKDIVGILVGSAIIWGGIRMTRLQSRNWVMFAAILSLLPCFGSCGCCLGMPLGVWILVIVSRPNISRHFR